MSQLLPETKRLLKSSEEPLDLIAAGAKVKRRWLYMFKANKIPNPGVVLVQRVHDYLQKNGGKAA
jgi:hypothetical protein